MAATVIPSATPPRTVAAQAFLAFLCGLLLFGGYAAFSAAANGWTADAWLLGFTLYGGSLGTIVATVFLLARLLERRFGLPHFPALLVSGLACSTLLHLYRNRFGDSDGGWAGIAIIGLILACTAYVPTLFLRPARSLSSNVEP